MTNNESDIKSFVRGGQIFLHNLRMLNQVMKKVGMLCLVLFVTSTVLYVYLNTTEYQRYLCLQYFTAKFYLLISSTAKQSFINPTGDVTKVFSSQIIHASFIQATLQEIVSVIIKGVILGLIIKAVAFSATFYWLRKRGKLQSQNTLLKGDRILSCAETKTLIHKKKHASDLILGGLPLIKNSETAHLFFHGTTGTGKSNAIKDLLDQIRKRGDRAIIYDKSCNYLEEFFEPNRDVLLNPLDERGREWDLWLECRDSADFDSLAAAQIPMPSSAQ